MITNIIFARKTWCSDYTNNLGLERNLLADDEKERDTMTVRVIKNRLSGKTGVVSLIYNQDTGVLEEEDIPYDLP